MRSPIITLGDGTEVLRTTGDVDALEHGGGVLFRPPDRRGFFWSFWEARELGQKNYHVFTAPVPDDVLEYFSPDVNEISKFADIDIRHVKRMGKSRDPRERLEIVIAIRDCCGSSRVDPSHEPEILTPFEMADRWGTVFGRNPKKTPILEYEDFIVRETSYHDYECGCLDGRYLGRHTSYKHALCAVADFMKNYGMENSNVFHEHEFMWLELVNWDPSTFVGKIPKRRGKIPETRWRAHVKRYVSSEIFRKGIDKQASKQIEIYKERKKAIAKLNQKKRIDHAREQRQ